MTNGKITRRVFIRAMAWLSTLGVAGADRALAGFGIFCPADAAHNLFFRHPESAAVIGREYLKDRPGESDARVLGELISISSGGTPDRTCRADPDDIRRRLRRRVRLDFEEGRVVKVRGWILSETEARLCALAAIT